MSGKLAMRIEDVIKKPDRIVVVEVDGLPVFMPACSVEYLTKLNRK